MPRNMSFMLTTEQIRKRTKDVTRRVGWWTVKPGEILQAVEKCQGLKKGEKIVHICKIQVLSTKAVELHEMNRSELIREGFPDMSESEFIEMFCRSHKGCTPETIVNRIEFKYL